MSIYDSLGSVMQTVQGLGKHQRNTGPNGYAFRGVDAVMNAVGPALREHKVIVTPNVRDYTYGEILTGKDRRPMGHARVVVEYTFWAADGSHIVCSAAGEAFDAGDKATPKAMSIAFRTALLQALCLPTDEPDPDAATYERAEGPRDVVLRHHKGDFAAATESAARNGFDNLRDPDQLASYAALIAAGQA